MSGRCTRCATEGRRGCSVEGCARIERGHSGLCNLHRQRARKHGDPTHERWAPLMDRIRSRIDFSSGCWTWTGVLSDGYGQVWNEGRMVGVHRVVYEAAYGPIPDGLVIDHLCRNPSCVNPLHLEAVTQSENARRGLNGVLRGGHANA